MIDLMKALDGDEAESRKVALLSSRGIVNEVLRANPEVTCAAVLQLCAKEIRLWDGERGPAEPALAGWIHLFAELRRSRSAECGSCSCVDTAAAQAANDPYSFLLAALLHLAKGDVPRAVFLDSGATPEAAASGKQIAFWDAKLSALRPGPPARKPPARTGVGHVLVMHLLELALHWYNEQRDVQSRSLLNLFLVPLLRMVYSQPDRAHLTYACYWYGEPVGPPYSPFHSLYALDLGILEDFQSRGVARRSEVLAALRAHLDNPNEALLRRKINHVLHGVDESGEADSGPTTSPKPKMTRVSQLTCLIREIDSSTDGQKQAREQELTRKYSPHLGGVQYRQATLVGNESPGKFDWSLMDDAKSSVFADCVASRYEPGHEADFLDKLFRPRANEPARLPVWIQDGEITFLWLLAALKAAALRRGERAWILGGGPGAGLYLSKRDIAGEHIQDDKDVTDFLPLGSSLERFATERACLFHTGAAGGDPRPKAWALWNFLQRAVVSIRPPEYSAGGGILGEFVRQMYDALYSAGLSLDGLRTACDSIVQGDLFRGIRDLRGIEKASRLPTFLLEVFLRDADPTPYSLFFYPISFEKLKGERRDLVVPSAFVAGTFGGLEWDCFPSVTDRQNYHLFSVLDAIRPLVDHELGAVLGTDQSRFLAERVNREIASDRARTVAAVTPAAAKLSDLFRQARSHIARIEAAVNPDWGNLFGTELAPAVSSLFESGSSLPMRSPAEPNLYEIDREHAPARRSDGGHKPELWTRLGKQMVYLARNFANYTDSDPLWGANDALVASEWRALEAKRLFEDQPFLGALTEHAITRKAGVDPLDLGLLLKLLAVDASDNDRGISIVQLAAALGQARRSEGTCVVDGRQIVGAFNPEKFDGVTKLAKLMELVSTPDTPAEQAVNTSDLRDRTKSPRIGLVATPDAPGERKVSTGDLRGRAKLPKEVMPFQPLRAMSVLAGPVLTTERPGWMALKSWKLTWRPTAGLGEIEIELTCQNWFTSKTKEMLWAYGPAAGETYHDLRTNFGVLWQAVGAVPNFVRLRDVNALKELQLEPDDRFVIVELADGGEDVPGRCSIWRLLLGRP